MREVMKRRTFRFGTIDFSLIRRRDLQPLVTSWAAEEPRTLSITLTGAHGVTESLHDPEVQRAHDDADFVLCDGTPPFIGAVLRGHRTEIDRILGIEAMLSISSAAIALGLQQAFVGGPPGLAERTIAGLERVVGVPIHGVAWSPPFVPSVDDAFADAVADRLRVLRRPAVVWIGLSTPKQEILAARLKQRLPGGFLLVAVGAAFDVYAGTLKPPPRIVSQLGMSWLYRVVLEPRRLAGRYMRAFPVVAEALVSAIQDRISGRTIVDDRAAEPTRDSRRGP